MTRTTCSSQLRGPVANTVSAGAFAGSAGDDILGGVGGLLAEEPAIRLYHVADAVQ